MNYLQIYDPNLKVKPHVTEQEAKAIWNEAAKPHVRMLIKTLWYTGLRITEALTIKACDIVREGLDFSVLVYREKQFKNSKKKPRKAPEPEQDKVPIPRDFGLDLYDYAIREGIKGQQRLFPANRSTYWRQVRECAKRAGIPNWHKVHPHSFRHGFVYDKAMKGVHPYVLSKLAGHSQLKTTMEYYQPTEADLRKAVEL